MGCVAPGGEYEGNSGVCLTTASISYVTIVNKNAANGCTFVVVCIHISGLRPYILNDEFLVFLSPY